MPSRLAIALLGISFVSASGNCQPPIAAGSEHFEISGADGKVVIAADDVLAYEWASHTLTLKPMVRKNLFEKLKGKLGRGEPFIVSVGGKAVYQGNWKSFFSSIPCTTPVIVLDGRALDPKLGEDQVRIELGYPSKDFFKGEDPRGDQRVRNALEASGKLKQGRPMEQAPRTLEKPRSEAQAKPKPERAEKAESPADRNTNAACNASLRQEPPSGSRTSAWAEASHGLRCRVTSPAEVEQGMPLEVTVEFCADSETDEPRARRLNPFLLPAFLELWLVEPQTSRRFVVRPYDPTQGMQVLDAGKGSVPLDGGSLKPWRVSFPLARLYDELRPGRYACRVQYSFPKTPTRFWAGSEQEWRKASFWNGTVVSGQFDLKLKPETPKTITLLLPKRLGVVKELVQLRTDDDKKSAVPVIRFRSRDAEKVALPVRNGHFVMAQYYRDGKLKGLGRPPKLVDDVYDIDTWYDYQGGDKKTSYTIEVFETRDPPGHEWSPNRESGGYKVLWKKTFVVSVSEDQLRELQTATSGSFGPDLVAALVSKDISNEARDAVVEELSQGDVANTAPRILKLLGEYSSHLEPGMGAKPWMHDSHSLCAKVWYASHAIWDALFRGEADPAKVKLLIKLLEDHEDPYLRHVVLGTMRSQWTDEAEKPVFNLFQNPQVPASTREGAIKALLQHCGERYVPHAIDFVQSAVPEKKSARFQRVFNIGNKFFSYSQKNRSQILSIGFSILEDEANGKTRQGYFIAVRLGFYLKIPDEFQPDQRAPQYQGRNGLNEKFFSDTVQNALEWRRKNVEPAEKSYPSWE